MFSGIVEATSSVCAVSMHGRCLRVSITVPRGWELAVGESVNIDGVCSTVIGRQADTVSVEYMPKTLKQTKAGSLNVGSSVNLECSLMWRGRISGHFVAGHVDGVGKVTAVTKRGRSRMVSVRVPAELSMLIAARGSVAVDGVSLTIARASRNRFEVGLIPHTLRHTNLRLLAVGDRVNIECDLLARYALKKPGGRVHVHAAHRTHKKS